MTKLPSDALKTPPRPLRTALIAVGSVAAISAAAFLGVPVISQAFPASVTTSITAAPADAASSAPLTAADLGSVQAAADAQQAQVAADAAAQAAATAAAAQAAAQAAAAQAAAQAAQKAAAQAAARKAASSTAGTKHPAGTPLPFITSTDPNNAAGGTYEDPSVFCTSGSASTVGGVPTCD